MATRKRNLKVEWLVVGICGRELELSSLGVSDI